MTFGELRKYVYEYAAARENLLRAMIDHPGKPTHEIGLSEIRTMSTAAARISASPVAMRLRDIMTCYYDGVPVKDSLDTTLINRASVFGGLSLDDLDAMDAARML